MSSKNIDYACFEWLTMVEIGWISVEFLLDILDFHTDGNIDY